MNETALLSTAAKNLIEGLNSNDNSAAFENWNILIASLNKYSSYCEIPYLQDLPLAMYLYVTNYSSKRKEENSIRAITTFGVLINAIEHAEGTEKWDYLALVSLLLTRHKNYFLNSNNYSIFPITEPKITENFNQTIIDYGNTAAYFDSIFLFIYHNVNINNQSFFGYENLKSKFISNKDSFFSEYHQHDNSIETIDGEQTIRDCYNRMNQAGKCPLYVPSVNNTEFYNKTYGFTDVQSFIATRFFLDESSGTMSEGELSALLNIDIKDGKLILSSTGINVKYLRNGLCLSIREIRVNKIKQNIEMIFNINNDYRDDTHRYGNVDNVPVSMNLYFKQYKLSEIVLDFIIGDEGWMRTLHFYG